MVKFISNFQSVAVIKTWVRPLAVCVVFLNKSASGAAVSHRLLILIVICDNVCNDLPLDDG